MAKRVILAVAGAGKTYHICHEIDSQKRNLILAFTHENIYNIHKELCDAHGCVPELTTVSTFDSFVYNQLILPYEPSIGEHFGCPQFISRGICTTDPPPRTIEIKKGKNIPNPQYINKDKLEHYITSRNEYYCATLSELVLQVKNKRESLIKRSAAKLNLFYDCVLIDEFQDFREYDYELIMGLSKLLNNIILVGDYYQHSVSAVNNSGKPFKKKTVDVSYDEFMDDLKSAGFEVDITTLDKSRRCSAEICEYVSSKLGINITSCSDNAGSVIWVDENAPNILEDNKITKLVFKDAASCTFRAMNWSYSKGDTLDAACVILTDKFEKLGDDKFSTSGISAVTINKLYVAMTRSRGDLYLMRFSTFKKLRGLYMKG